MLAAAHFAAVVLLNSLWEAPLVALLAWICLRCTPNGTASTRYIVWLIALLAACALPFATADVASAPAPQTGSARGASVSANAKPVHPVVAHRTNPSTVVAPSGALWLGRPAFTLPRIVAISVAAVWALAAAMLLLKLLAELIALERFKRDALPLPFEYRERLGRLAEQAGFCRDTRVCVSSQTDVPVAIGLFDAMILLPEPLLSTLSAEEIEHIALHELAHLRRRDDWSNALERVLATIFFFNPGVRWIAAQMDLEREVACDDHVVQLTHEVRPYAYCLTKMAQTTQWPRTALAAPGVFVTRKSISIRIERLLRATSSRRLAVSYATALAAVVAVLLVFVGARSFGPVIAAPVSVVSVQTAPAHVNLARAARAVKSAAKPPAAAATVLPTPAEQSIARTPKSVRAVLQPHARSTKPLAVPRGARTEVAAVPAAGVSKERATDGLHCDGCDLQGVNWRGRDLRGAVLRGAYLNNADLRDTDLRDADLSGASLAGARLDGANLQGTRLDGIAINGALLVAVDLSGAQISGSNVDTSSITPAQLRQLLDMCAGCSYGRLNAQGMNLSGVHVQGVNLADADFRNADLRNAVFDGVNFAHAQFRGARLDGTTFNGCMLKGADFHGVDLSGARFAGTDLSGVLMP